MTNKIEDFEIFKLENILESLSDGATVGDAKRMRNIMLQDYIEWRKERQPTFKVNQNKNEVPNDKEGRTL